MSIHAEAGGRAFPVALWNIDIRRYADNPIPTSVPWSLVERHRWAIEAEYGTTLENLAKGRQPHHYGLDPIELNCACHNEPFHLWAFGIDGANNPAIDYATVYKCAVKWLRTVTEPEAAPVPAGSAV
jgi:hypothetical protein